MKKNVPMCLNVWSWVFSPMFQVPRGQKRRAHWNCIQQVDPDGRQHRRCHENVAVQQHEAVECELGDQNGKLINSVA